jgi:hypothetical protein
MAGSVALISGQLKSSALSHSQSLTLMATSGLEVAEAIDLVAQDDSRDEFQDLVGVPYAVIESDPGLQTVAGNYRVSHQGLISCVIRGLYFHIAETGHKPPGSRNFDTRFVGAWLPVRRISVKTSSP